MLDRAKKAVEVNHHRDQKAGEVKRDQELAKSESWIAAFQARWHPMAQESTANLVISQEN